MPELPDVIAYIESLEPRVVDQTMERAAIISPFVLRTFEPPIEAIVGRRVTGVRRLGKRIVLAFDDDLFAVIHLMIAGRFRWLARTARPPGKIALLMFDFPTGRLALVEAAQKKRASLHIVAGEESLKEFRAGGLHVLHATCAQFAAVLLRENHTLKRALTDPRFFDGIGNAYSDEILHAARLSPLKQTSKLTDAEVVRLHDAAKRTLVFWIDRLRRDFAGGFPGPGQITAFRPDFAVHGKFGRPCSVCGSPVQRIRYADNETNYCAMCQNEGRLLADRSLSRLLRADWPRTLEDLEGR